MKRLFLLLLCLCMLVCLVGCGKDEKGEGTKEETKEVDNKNNDKNEESKDNMVVDTKGLVLYFSATGTTEKVAKLVGEASGSDILEIVPKEKYTNADLSYNNDNCRANKEQNDDRARPEIKNEINIDKYSTIYIGYPIWWGTNPKIILTLFDNVNFDGKNVVLFCTSGSSGIEESANQLKQYNDKVNWIGAKRFESSAKLDEVKSWIKSLN